MASNLILMQEYIATGKRKKGCTFHRDQILKRMQKEAKKGRPTGAGYYDKMSMEKRTQHIWWNFLCCKAYLMHMDNGDGAIKAKDMRLGVKLHFAAGQLQMPSSDKALYSTPLKEGELQGGSDDDDMEEEDDAECGSEGSKQDADKESVEDDGTKKCRQDDSSTESPSDATSESGSESSEESEDSRLPPRPRGWNTAYYLFQRDRMKSLGIAGKLEGDEFNKFHRETQAAWNSLDTAETRRYSRLSEEDKRRYLAADKEWFELRDKYNSEKQLEDLAPPNVTIRQKTVKTASSETTSAVLDVLNATVVGDNAKARSKPPPPVARRPESDMETVAVLGFHGAKQPPVARKLEEEFSTSDTMQAAEILKDMVVDGGKAKTEEQEFQPEAKQNKPLEAKEGGVDDSESGEDIPVVQKKAVRFRIKDDDDESSADKENEVHLPDSNESLGDDKNEVHLLKVNPPTRVDGDDDDDEV